MTKINLVSIYQPVNCLYCVPRYVFDTFHQLTIITSDDAVLLQGTTFRISYVETP